MKIVLLGYMGVGKSTLGQLLAESLKLKFIDLDHYIETKEQLSIPELFQKKGEIYFRKIESEALKEVMSMKEDAVLSLGGGTPVYGENMNVIVNAKAIASVYIKLQLKDLVDKLFEQRHSRPIISHYESKSEFEEFVRKHLFERQPYYYKAQHVLDVTGKKPTESLKDLIEVLDYKS